MTFETKHDLPTGIYLDNACTSFPKPACVPQAINDFLCRIGSNVARGSYASAFRAEELVFETRELLCDLFHGPDPSCVVFTANITQSLNMLLKGLLRPGDHVLVTSMEHNAVMRPLQQLASCGVTFSRVPCRPDGTLMTEQMENLLQDNTKAFVSISAGNVCGTIMPFPEIGAFCRKHDLIFIADTAQTAGLLPLDMNELGIDALAFTGHKALLGPQGIGGFVITPKLAQSIEPLLSGGTGSFSHTEEVPRIMPDRFEAGTMNLPGIAGLRASLLYLRETGINSVFAHEMRLTEQFLRGIRPLSDAGSLRIVGPEDTHNRVGTVSIVPLSSGDLRSIQKDAVPDGQDSDRSIPGISVSDPAELAQRLDEEFSIRTRVGLHCAPIAHKTLGTFPTGTVRFSFGYANTEEEVDLAVHALSRILAG